MKSLYLFNFPDAGGAPITRADNKFVWALECIASRALRLHYAVAIGLDGSSNVMVQRLTRHSAIGTGTRTAITATRTDPDMLTPPGDFFITSVYGTSDPTPGNGDIKLFGYNAQGGQVEFYDEDGVYVRGAASLGLHHDTGAGQFKTGGSWSQV